MGFSFITNNADETIKLGEQLSRTLMPGDVVGFFGNLGSGKTHMIKGICSGLNCANEVSSPTFTLINEYNGSYPVYHFDFYRIETEGEVFDLGYEEYFYGSGICLIEWAERVTSFFPEEYISVYLNGIFEKGKENIREITIKVIGNQVKERPWNLLGEL